ncbi:uncharacterized protein LOC108993896 [Juglans regia]|uniref:Uncharacterized protein LOC108993896 n=1 Tax=Juglans regia TaxID=51240 RepID=A0A6P9EEC5_JUGRE|nr:uncharacterized protein LOC108993896 [Juglans regia]
MTVHQYAARFTELSRFATYLVPDEEKKAHKFEQRLNEKLYVRVVGFQIRNFSELVNKATIFERTLQRSVALHEQRKRTTPTGYQSGMDQGPWKRRSEGSNSGKRPVPSNQQPYQCRTCNQVHSGECRKGAGLCFRCGKSGHYIRDCPMQNRSNQTFIPPPQRNEVSARGSNQRPTAPARVFALTPGEVEGRNDVITDAERLRNKLVVATPTGNSVVCSEMLPGCPLSIEGRLMPADLIVFHMVGFDVILGMDWLASYHASIDCAKKEVVFRPPNEEMEKKTDTSSTVDQLLVSSNLPYSEEILAMPFPPKFKVPQMEAYDGSKDPLEHLDTFKAHKTLHGFLGEVAYRAFPANSERSSPKLVWGLVIRNDRKLRGARLSMMQFLASYKRRLPAAYLQTVK